MLTYLVIGAIIGSATCYFLLDHLGLINYELIFKLIERYDPKDIPSPVQKTMGTKVTSELIERYNPKDTPSPVQKKLDTKITSDVALDSKKIPKKARLRVKHQSLRRIKRVLHQIQASEKSDEFPFNSVIMGEKEPLWNHRFSAKLQAAMSNIYEAWRRGDDKGWMVSSSYETGLKVLRKQKCAGHYIIKGTILITYPIGMIMEEINNKESILKYQTNTKDQKELTSYGPCSGVTYTLFKTPSTLVLPRDLVWVYGTCLTERDGNVVLVPGTSVVFNNFPRCSGKIRAELNFGGWVFEVFSSSSTMATYILDIDIQGSLPQWITTEFFNNAAKTPLNLFNFMKEKHGPYLPAKSSEVKRGSSNALRENDNRVINSLEDDKYDSQAWGSSYALRENDHRVINGSEDDKYDSQDESTEISSLTCTEFVYSEIPSTIGSAPKAVNRLTTQQKTDITKKLNGVISTILWRTDPRRKRLWRRTSSKEKGVAILRPKDGKRDLMGQSIVQLEPRKIYNALLKLSFREVWDPMLKSLRVVEEFSNLKVLHMQHQTKNCVESFRRDVLAAVKGKEVGSKFIVAGTSVPHPACPENQGMKRADIAVYGWVVEVYKDRPGHSKVSLVLDIDFKQLPHKVARLVNKTQVMTIYNLAVAIKHKDGNGK